MAIQYKRIELRTVKDYDQVDRLLANGWKAIQGGMFSVLLEKRSARKAVKASARN